MDTHVFYGWGMKRMALDILIDNSEGKLHHTEVWTSNVGNEQEAVLIETQKENTSMRNNKFRCHVIKI